MVALLSYKDIAQWEGLACLMPPFIAVVNAEVDN